MVVIFLLNKLTRGPLLGQHGSGVVVINSKLEGIDEEGLPVGGGGAPGADVDVARLLVAGQRDPRQQLHLSRRL